MRTLVVTVVMLAACETSETNQLAESAGSCGEPLTATGVLHTSVADIVVDRLPVWVHAVYKRDVDAFEAGCVRRFVVQIGDVGCILELVFDRAGAPAGLRSVFLGANSSCPGFWDAAERGYSRGLATDMAFAPRWPEGLPVDLAPADGPETCVRGVALRFPGMAYTLKEFSLGSSAVPELLRVDLSDLAITGDLMFLGDPTNTPCEPIAASCGDAAHDGGDGLCMPPGTCSPGHPIDDVGTCSAFPSL